MGKLWGRFGKLWGQSRHPKYQISFKGNSNRWDILFGAATFWWFSKCYGNAPVPLMHLKWSEGTGDGWKHIGNHSWVDWSRFGPDVFHRGLVSVNCVIPHGASASLCAHSIGQVSISCTPSISFSCKPWACTPLFPPSKICPQKLTWPASAFCMMTKYKCHLYNGYIPPWVCFCQLTSRYLCARVTLCPLRRSAGHFLHHRQIL